MNTNQAPFLSDTQFIIGEKHRNRFMKLILLKWKKWIDIVWIWWNRILVLNISIACFFTHLKVFTLLVNRLMSAESTKIKGKGEVIGSLKRTGSCTYSRAFINDLTSKEYWENVRKLRKRQRNNRSASQLLTETFWAKYIYSTIRSFESPEAQR